MSFDTLVAACLTYVGVMFAVAWGADRAAAQGRAAWTGHPLIYTLSLSVYCSAWTFYGAVGYAHRAGLEYLTIYLGPTVVFAGSWWALRKLIRVARMHRVTSVADMISARFGKSNPLAATITLMLVVASLPYIALQLQSIALSFAVFGPGDTLPGPMGLWVAGGLALFAILFGTRNLDADERHHGVVTAIALEAVVKLLAFVAIGVWVVWGLADGPVDIAARIAEEAARSPQWTLKPDRWTALVLVSGAAVVLLPRMFQVLVVEAADERRLDTAAWAFPAYLLTMSLFVLPITVVGRSMLPDSVPADFAMLHLPLSQGKDGLALLVFLGGFSAATSMVVIAALALATMVSNHWLVPGWLVLRRAEQGRDSLPDMRRPVLIARRVAILAVIAAGAGYQHLSGGGQALASMGTVAFVGVAQLLPAMLGGLLWRGATRQGAFAGVLTGFALWLMLLFLPSVGLREPMGHLAGLDPLAAVIFLSLSLNLAAFIGVSLVSFPDPQERLQALSFVHSLPPQETVGLNAASPEGGDQAGERAEALLTMARRVWGADDALHFFRAEADRQGKTGFLPDVSPGFLARLERRLAGSVGTATAHAMLAQVTGARVTTMAELMEVATEAKRAKERALRLQGDQEELARTARRLREANERLTALSIQKDAFLGQISHELRTPMTSIRAFSEFLRDPTLDQDNRLRFAAIIHEESTRLTRLLDELLDLSVLESGRAQLHPAPVNLHDLINRAITASSATRSDSGLLIDRNPPAEHINLITDPDRLQQVLINVISNARKYCDSERPVLTIRARRLGDICQIDLTDNGSGIPAEKQALVFEKFSRLNDPTRAGGAGLGLAITREVMNALGGTIDYLPGQGGAAFRIELPTKLPGLGGAEESATA